MRKGWSITTIGEAARIASGQVDPKDVVIASMISVGPDNLPSGGGLDKSSLKTAQELGQISGKYAFNSSSILYSKIRPNLNKVALPDFNGICSADMYPMWVADEQCVDRNFLYYTLVSERFVATASSRSFRTGMPKINRKTSSLSSLLSHHYLSSARSRRSCGLGTWGWKSSPPCARPRSGCAFGCARRW
jgi:type I restriction enzyme S subunit